MYKFCLRDLQRFHWRVYCRRNGCLKGNHPYQPHPLSHHATIERTLPPEKEIIENHDNRGRTSTQHINWTNNYLKHVTNPSSDPSTRKKEKQHTHCWQRQLPHRHQKRYVCFNQKPIQKPKPHPPVPHISTLCYRAEGAAHRTHTHHTQCITFHHPKTLAPFDFLQLRNIILKHFQIFSYSVQKFCTEDRSASTEE